MNGYNSTTMEKSDMFTCHFNRNAPVIEKKEVVAQEEAPVKNNTAVKNKESVKSNDSIKNVESSKPVVKEKPAAKPVAKSTEKVRLLVVVKLQ